MRDNENSKCPRQPLVLVCGLKRAWTYRYVEERLGPGVYRTVTCSVEYQK